MRALGWSPHPWQEQALDVAMEVDDRGHLVYGEGLWLIPRRSGKTVIGLSKIVHRAHAFDDEQRSISNMHKKSEARGMFRNAWLPTLRKSRYAGTFTPRLALSEEAIEWHHGPIHQIKAPGPDAAVGSDLDYWLNDECWALPSDEMEGAVLPTMATRVDAQVDHMSMAGTQDSQFLVGKRNLGREMVQADARSGLFYIEFAAPDDADPMDERVWWQVHPALGLTVTVERLRQYAASMSEEEFGRQFLGIWRDTIAELPALIDAETWASHRESKPRHPRAQIARPYLAVDASPDRSSAAVSVAGKRPDGRPQVEVIRHDDGTSWVVEYVASVVAKSGPAEVVLDAGGPASFLLPDLERALRPHRMSVRSLGYKDAANAAATWMATFGEEGNGRYVHHPGLDAANAGAQLKVRGDLSTINRRSPSTDLPPLISCALALWAMTSPSVPERVKNTWLIL